MLGFMSLTWLGELTNTTIVLKKQTSNSTLKDTLWEIQLQIGNGMETPAICKEVTTED